MEVYMGNVELKNHVNKLVEAYIFDHPFDMSVLLRNIEGNEWDILYANLLAMQCFAGELNQKATDFFGDDWSTIEEGLSNSHNRSEYTTELYINKDGVKTLVEMTVQQ